MTISNQEFQKYYQLGKKALENGKYKVSITNLQSAKKLVNFASNKGAEVQMLLATAYQAVGQKQEAIALCQELMTHPNGLIRQKAKDVLYIIQAPELERPIEWMSEIPDLSSDETPKAQYVTTKRKKTSSQQSNELPPIDPQANTEDNQFVWFALIIAILTVISLIWISQS